MNGSAGDQRQRNLSKTVSLSRSVVLTQDTCIPSVLILGKLLRVSCSSDGGAGAGAADDYMGLVRARLLQDWAAEPGSVSLWPVTDGAFLVQFQQAADLTRVVDGAPWCCDGGRLFLMRQAKPEVNLVDQLAGVGFTTADLWVQFHFHNVPVEYFNTSSLCALAMHIGVPVLLPDLGTTAPVHDRLRVRIQVDLTKPLVHAIPVDLDDGRSEQVSVVYEQIPSLCHSCGIIDHPAGRCRTKANPQPVAAASSRSRGDKAVGFGWSRLGSRTSSSSREKENQPLLGKEKDDDHPISNSTSTGSSSATLLPKPIKPGEPSAAADHLRGPGTLPDHVSVNRCVPCNFGNIFRKKKKEPVVRHKTVSNGGVNNELEHMATMTDMNQLLLIFSSKNQSVHHQESLTMEQQGTTSPDRLAPSTLTTSFQLAGGYVSYYQSGSRRNPRIEVKVETQCSSHLMNKAMEWLAENTGLKASFDGKRGVVSIVGLQLDQRMGPLDIVAYLYPEAGPKSGASEPLKKPDSPARFEDMMKCFLDENSSSKSASSSRSTTRFGFGS